MTEDELRAYVEQQHLLDELAKHPGWEVLTEYALARPGASVDRQRRLVNGAAKDWDDYRYEVGWLQGVQFVLDARKTVADWVATARLALAEAAETDE